MYGKDSAAAVGLRVYGEKTAAVRAGAERFPLGFHDLVRIVEDPAVPLEQFALLRFSSRISGPCFQIFERFLYDFSDMPA